MEFKTIRKSVQGELVEKKSKFIANIEQVVSIEQAEEFYRKIKEQHKEAKHHCFAYRVYTKEGIIERCSDDKEPSGTAGGPMLQILNKNALCNIMVVVTRYFGGILLGTGGLIRAYTGATWNALETAEICEQTEGILLKVIVEYAKLESFKYYCYQHRIKIMEIQYQEKALVQIQVEKENIGCILETNMENMPKLLGVEIIGDKIMEKISKEE